MKLLYLYVYSYGHCLSQTGINFVPDFNVSFSNGTLSVTRKDDKTKGYYGTHVESITLFLGKNGTGKTTILDILGMNRLDMEEDSDRHNASYFALYHLYDDFYAAEFTDKSFFDGDNRIRNISLGNETPESIMYHNHMGTIMRYDSKKIQWNYDSKILLDSLKNKEIKQMLEYHYILTDTKTGRALSRRDSNYHSYMFNRHYYFNRSIYQYLLRHFHVLSSMDTFITDSDYEFEFTDEADNNAFIGDSIRDDTPEGFAEKCKDEIENIFIYEELSSKLSLAESVNRHSIPSAFKGSGNKDSFIYYLYARAAVFIFFYKFIQLKWIKSTQLDSYSENDFQEFIAEFGEEAVKNGNFDLFEDFNPEYSLLRYVIDKYCPKGTIEGAEKLLSYVLGRYTREDAGDYDIKRMFMAMIESLKSLPEEFFVSWKEMKISCISSISNSEDNRKNIEEFLELYGMCEEYINFLRGILSVRVPGTSLGQAEFLGIMSRVSYALSGADEGDNMILILDEPDRSMHPEMSRLFMNELLELINRIAKCQVQIIMSSHSPFIVTDIFTEGVYQLESSDKGIKITHPEGTFAANIYKILMRPFMLGSTFGEYTLRKIKEFLERLSSGAYIPDDELEMIHAVISRVGEPVLKNKLLEKYYDRDRKKKLIDELSDAELDDNALNKIEAVLRENKNVQDRDN